MQLILRPGERVGPYVVEAELGRGGLAVVVRVRHIQTGQLRALKLLSTRDHETRNRLLQEGRFQSTPHPNIVSVLETIEHAGMVGLVMELVQGPALSDVIADYQPTIDEVCGLMGGILSAVQNAHDRGLIHRDLKPGNVLLHITEDGVYPKVADFGLAKSLASDVTGVGTRQGTVMGTPHYMAPEQIHDTTQLTQKADLFSLGVVLYRLCCGQVPFGGKSAFEVMRTVSVGNYESPSRQAPGLPPPIAEAIHAALNPDPANRVGSARELAGLMAGRDGAIEELLPTFLPADSGLAAAARGVEPPPPERYVLLPEPTGPVPALPTPHSGPSPALYGLGAFIAVVVFGSLVLAIRGLLAG